MHFDDGHASKYNDGHDRDDGDDSEIGLGFLVGEILQRCDQHGQTKQSEDEGDGNAGSLLPLHEECFSVWVLVGEIKSPHHHKRRKEIDQILEAITQNERTPRQLSLDDRTERGIRWD